MTEDRQRSLFFRLLQRGMRAAVAVSVVAALYAVEEAVVRSLVSERPASEVYDEEVAVFSRSADLASASAWVSQIQCAGLDDDPGEKDRCLADNAEPLTRRVCNGSGAEVGRLSVFRVTPSMRALARDDTRPAGVGFLRGIAGFDDIRARLAAGGRVLCE